MNSWGTQALTRYSCEDFPYRTTWSRLLQRKEEMRWNIWFKIPLDLIKVVRKTNTPKSVESFGYTKCYSTSSSRLVKSPSNSIRHNCQKISCCVYFPSYSIKCISCFMLEHLMTNIFPSFTSAKKSRKFHTPSRRKFSNKSSHETSAR